MKARLGLCLALALLAPAPAPAYPLDAFEETGIRRLEYSRLAHEGVVEGPRQPAGARLPRGAIGLRLTAHPDLQIPAPDPEFTRQVVEILGQQADRYSLLILDLSDIERPAYAEHRPHEQQNVGSVGKVLAALGLFQALADTWPDPACRAEVLRTTQVTADAFSQTDHHAIKLFDVDQRVLTQRPMQVGDRGNLWEYLDWMLSVSSNAAAAMVMREAMLIRRFGTGYPPSEAALREYFSASPAGAKTALFQETFWTPVTRNGLDLERIRQGSFFTAGGKRFVNGGGLSYATPRALLRFLVLMEQGLLVDAWSSLEMKRLLYVTERRIRYASSPELAPAAVFSKSGSLWSCVDEPGFTCRPYHGNQRNWMNSISIVEQDLPGGRLHYLVVLISNVLRVNSAVTHQSMASEVHRLIRERHAPPAATD